MQSKEKQTLTRIALYEGQICVDPSGRAKGRGVYLCKNSPDSPDIRYQAGLSLRL